MAIEFNNMSLPDIPVDIIKTHPYIIIFYNIEKNLTIMYVSTKEFVYTPGDLVSSSIPYLTKSFGEVLRYNYISETNVWEKSPVTYEDGAFVFDEINSILWSNHNVYYIDSYDSETGEYTKTSQIYIDVHLPKPPENIIAEFPYYYIKKSNVNEMEVWFLVATKSPATYIPSSLTNTGYNKMISESIGYRVMAFSPTTIQSYAVLGMLEGGTNSWQKNTVVDDKIYIDNYFQTVRDKISTSNYDIYIATSYDGDETVTIGSELYFVNPHKKITSDSHYKAIATKVREILGESTQYKPRELPDAIRNTLDALNPYDINVGIVFRQSGMDLIGNILYPGAYTLVDDETIVIPSHITEIAPYAFTSSTHTKKIIFPEGLIKIGERACYNIPLTEIELPESLTTIGSAAFNSCDITSLTIPKNITTIEYGAFEFCKELIEVNVLCNYNSWDSIFNHNDLLERVDFKGNISNLGFWSFYGCNALTTLILRGSFCTLAGRGLENSGIHSGIGYIYVPSTLVDTYKKNSVWSTYASQIRAIEDYPEICDPTT